MLPLLLWEMQKVARVPVAPYPGLSVRQLSNDIDTDRDYDVGLKNVQSQRAHNVNAAASVELTSAADGSTEVWQRAFLLLLPTCLLPTCSDGLHLIALLPRRHVSGVGLHHKGRLHVRM